MVLKQKNREGLRGSGKAKPHKIFWNLQNHKVNYQVFSNKKDNLKKLEKITINYESQFESTKSQLQEAEEKIHSLKNALDNSYK
jgi:hypothetical protein